MISAFAPICNPRTKNMGADYMKELIPKDDHGIFADTKDRALVDSRFVAQEFDKRHDNVIQDIRNLDCSAEFRLLNFQESSYKNLQGRNQPCFAMTRDGFMFLVMGYRGKKAAAIKEAYIHRFNQMEKFIEDIVTARTEFPLLTQNISLLHDNPRPYHFSNECDMLNRLVIGKTAKEFREEHDIEKGKSIRPYLTPEQVRILDVLQKVDIGLLLSVPNLEQRKHYLEFYKMKTGNKILDKKELEICLRNLKSA